MSYEFTDFFGNKVTVYSRKEWFDMFVEYCQKIYEEKRDFDGSFCCGYHWCCDECEGNLCCGCADCVATIIEILEKAGVKIDRSNINFEYWEKLAKEKYENE